MFGAIYSCEEAALTVGRKTLLWVWESGVNSCCNFDSCSKNLLHFLTLVDTSNIARTAIDTRNHVLSQPAWAAAPTIESTRVAGIWYFKLRRYILTYLQSICTLQLTFWFNRFQKPWRLGSCWGTFGISSFYEAWRFQSHWSEPYWGRSQLPYALAELFFWSFWWGFSRSNLSELYSN